MSTLFIIIESEAHEGNPPTFCRVLVDLTSGTFFSLSVSLSNSFPPFFVLFLSFPCHFTLGFEGKEKISSQMEKIGGLSMRPLQSILNCIAFYFIITEDEWGESFSDMVMKYPKITQNTECNSKSNPLLYHTLHHNEMQ